MTDNLQQGALNYLWCSDIPVNSNGINTVSVFAVIASDGTIAPAGGFTPSVTFQFNDSTTSNPQVLTGTFAGSYSTGGTLSGSFSGQFNGSISLTLGWMKPVPCYRYCHPQLVQQNSVLTMQ